MNEYEKMANDFLRKVGAKMTVSFLRNDYYFDKDRERRNVYRVRIERNGKSMSFTFGDSVYNTQKNIRPSRYSILACMEKFNPWRGMRDFVQEYGYEIEDYESYIRAERAYKACVRQVKQVERVFGDVIDELAEFC